MKLDLYHMSNLNKNSGLRSETDRWKRTEKPLTHWLTKCSYNCSFCCCFGVVFLFSFFLVCSVITLNITLQFLQPLSVELQQSHSKELAEFLSRNRSPLLAPRAQESLDFELAVLSLFPVGGSCWKL